MFHRYVNKYLVVCYLIMNIITNAVSDISLDYYFGNDESLRTTDNFGDCSGEALINSCNQKCGPSHACLLGKCFCVKVNPLSKENLSLVLLTEEGDEKTTESLEDFEDIPSATPKEYNDEELAARPTLRHHIAHFCPNLHDARTCIRKCMKIGKPAFCGKDHKCYCGHRYDTPGVEHPIDPSAVHNQYKDLYEKYFGPKSNRHHAHHHHAEVKELKKFSPVVTMKKKVPN